ncbi:fatty acid elongase [Trypanosoma rangeli]|uniref:Elongation of fatty acids protein n=1 Tax=Trypanosoma rangeli TaxID=5698 RepID=A0A3R7KG78_TRYRA|nr:fatty acid elongase [Trypanosoma rangeli]RNF07094.1 fatty acid elongase [Trypanosoma rangeli]|eukprot:RNF07094.1 fatty acid elongase [Trypanosoma rangeli]
MDFAVSKIQQLRNLPRNFKGEVATVVFDDSVDVLIYACVLYVVLVFCVPTHVMKNREPFNLRVPLIIWNLALCLFSVCGTVSCVNNMIYLYLDRGFYKTTCFFDKNVTFDGELAFWVFYFILSKIPEMLDTVFLVFQKKPVIFLHWYHHLTVTIFCWHAGSALISSGLWFATMNYCVHAIMYFYYFICACGLRKMIRPIAPFITMMQLLQMVVGTLIVGYTAYHSYLSGYGCEVNRTSIRLGLVMYASYFVLFAMLFGRLYLKKGKSTGVAAHASEKMRNGKN